MSDRKFVTGKSGRKYAMIPFSEIEASRENYTGFCIRCGEEKDCVEPDARKYRCEACGELAVYGGEQIALQFPALVLVDE